MAANKNSKPQAVTAADSKELNAALLNSNAILKRAEMAARTKVLGSVGMSHVIWHCCYCHHDG
jgi:hypothetical protein